MDPLYYAITNATNMGLIDVKTLRESVKPLFYTRMRLGLFDPPTNNPFAKLDPKTIVQSQEHRDLAIEAAMKTFVLLKNSNNVLPLRSRLKLISVAVKRYFKNNMNVVCKN